MSKLEFLKAPRKKLVLAWILGLILGEGSTKAILTEAPSPKLPSLILIDPDILDYPAP
ncbi:MAG: hypothetical protein QXI39_03320 [Candidatus Bathyarchaeia archaeon]